MTTRTGILNSSSVADRRAAYLAGTGRSVGRGRDLLASYQIFVMSSSYELVRRSIDEGRIRQEHSGAIDDLVLISTDFIQLRVSNMKLSSNPRMISEGVKILGVVTAFSDSPHESNSGRVRPWPAPTDFPVSKNESLSFFSILRFDACCLDTLPRAIISPKATIFVFGPNLDVPN